MIKSHSLVNNRQEIRFLIWSNNTGLGYYFILHVYQDFAPILGEKVLFDIGIWLWVIEGICSSGIAHRFVFLLYYNINQNKHQPFLYSGSFNTSFMFWQLSSYYRRELREFERLPILEFCRYPSPPFLEEPNLAYEMFDIISLSFGA